MKRMLLLALLLAGCISEAPEEIETNQTENHTEYKLYSGDAIVGYELREVSSNAVFCKGSDCRYLDAGDNLEYEEGECMFITEVSQTDKFVILYLADCTEEV